MCLSQPYRVSLSRFAMIALADQNFSQNSSDPLGKYPAMMTISDVAEACNLNRRTVERWERDGRLPHAIRHERFIRFRKSDIADWIANGCQQQNAAA